MRIEEIDIELNALKDNNRILRAVKDEVDELKEKVDRYDAKIHENLSKAEISFQELNGSA